MKPARGASLAAAPQGSASRPAIAGWLLFDLAAQPWFTLVTTFVYGPYFVSAIASTPADGQAWWGLATGIAGAIIAVLSPVLGAVADAGGRRKPWIFGFSLAVVIGSLMLWWGRPGDEAAVLIVLSAFVIGTIGVEFATVFTNAMMPDLVPTEKLGRLSGTGWAVGYVGGLITLVIVLGFIAARPESGQTLFGLTPILGLDPATHEGDRASGPFTALWYVVFILPLFLFTPDGRKKATLRASIGIGFRELIATVRDLKHYRNAFTYLIAHMTYTDGLVALFAFGGIYGTGVFGWSTIEIGIFGIWLTIAGTIGAVIGGRFDDLIGPKPVVLTAIAILIVSAIGILSVDRSHILFVVETVPSDAVDGLFSSTPEMAYMLLGGLIGAAAGPLQSASRTLLVRVAPRERLTQFFGLFALSGKLTSFMGPFAVGILTALSGSQRIGISVLVAFFFVGAVLLAMVRTEPAD